MLVLYIRGRFVGVPYCIGDLKRDPNSENYRHVSTSLRGMEIVDTRRKS